MLKILGLVYLMYVNPWQPVAPEMRCPEVIMTVGGGALPIKSSDTLLADHARRYCLGSLVPHDSIEKESRAVPYLGVNYDDYSL